ncbi:MAG TPA: DUF2147 domain-containing protein [Allosphingosinicella sp.]
MRRMLQTCFVLALGIWGIPAAGAGAAQMPEAGVWLTEDKSAVVVVRPCGGNLCAAIQKVNVRVPGGVPRDVKNPDPKLRGRALAGVAILSNVQRSGREWSGGKVYVPRTGSSYSARVKLLAADKLSVQGCVMMICRGEVWSRIK